MKKKSIFANKKLNRAALLSAAVLTGAAITGGTAIAACGAYKPRASKNSYTYSSRPTTRVKAQNPCASYNPCAAKNPCAGHNPCAAKNPCRGYRY